MMLTRGALFCFLLVTPSLALAEGGLWVEGTVGLRRTIGKHSYTDELNPGFGVSGPITLETDLNGTGVALGGRFGYAGSRYWAIGAGPSVGLMGFGSTKMLGASQIDMAVASGVVLDLRIRPLGDGLFVGPSVGWTRMRFTGSTNDIGSADNVYEFETLTGPEVGVVAGWTDGLLGVSAEVGYQHLSSEHGEWHPIFVGVSLVLQHWELE